LNPWIVEPLVVECGVSVVTKYARFSEVSIAKESLSVVVPAGFEFRKLNDGCTLWVEGS
jgi:hypothetical protein